jgi:hypothetical protein
LLPWKIMGPVGVGDADVAAEVVATEVVAATEVIAVPEVVATPEVVAAPEL